jgi:homocitrate synthase NifV
MIKEMPPLQYRPKIRLIDCTLRDGEQAPGVVFSPDEKIRIAEMLAEAGVDELEAGIPAMGGQERETIRSLAALNLPCRLISWCRSTSRDIELATHCGTEGVHISFPVSALHQKATRLKPDRIFERLDRLIRLAKRYFSFVSVGAQDALRADPAFVSDFVQSASAYGAHRVRIADTVGTGTPVSVHRLISQLLQETPEADIEFHGHNDLAMASANAVTAAQSGASALSVTVNGLGERAGNASLEAVSVALSLATTETCSICLEKLTPLCNYVSRAARRDIPADQPIAGSMVFSHESGIHCDGLLKNPYTYQPFLPQVVGRQDCRYVIGKHTGGRILEHMLQAAGIQLDRSQVHMLLKKVRKKASLKRQALSIEDLVQVYGLSPSAPSTCPELP